MQQTIIQTTAGDSAPDETLYLTREDGSIINVATAQSVQLIIVSPITGQHTNDGSNTCTIIDGPNGVVVYPWNSAGTDCPVAGTYRAYVRIIYADGSKETLAIRIEAGQAP